MQRGSSSADHRLRKGPSLAGSLDDYFKRGAPQPTWVQLARIHAGQYVAVITTLVLLAASERWEPFRHTLYAGRTSDLEIWKYSYPLRANHVPAWAVPCVSLLTPLLCIMGFRLAGRISRVEAQHACLLAVSCVATTGLLTNWIKINVGRFRPHFVRRCWPNGAKPVYSLDGMPQCAHDAINVAEGMKSFPSGHTSWSTSGLGYLTFWLLGKLQCFDGQAQPTRLVIALTPLLGAVWIGMSRVQDYWHHVEDVAAGFCLGLLFAYLHIRQVYGSCRGPQAGILTAAVRAAGGKGGLSQSPSRSALSQYGNGGGAEEQQHSGEDRV